MSELKLIHNNSLAGQIRKYYTIGDVSRLCSVKPHVLRYWEQEFPQLKPAKRTGNRRYYQQKDVLMVQQIYDLLYHKGYTINGARQFLVNNKKHQPATSGAPYTVNDAVAELEQILQELEV